MGNYFKNNNLGFKKQTFREKTSQNEVKYYWIILAFEIVQGIAESVFVPIRTKSDSDGAL